MNTGPKFAAAVMLLVLVSASCSPFLFPSNRVPGTVETSTPILVPSSAPEAVQPATPTAGPFVLDLTPLPSATALPPLELPTQPPSAGGTENWDGLPTYPAESRPDYYFRVQFDPIGWALTTDQFGDPVLANRNLMGCVLSPGSGRGLPPNTIVQHEVRTIGSVSFQISTASLGGTAKFVAYAGGDGSIYTAFEVSFADQAEACLNAAENVLATLRSVPLFEATPFGSP